MQYPADHTQGERYAIDNEPNSPFYEGPCEHRPIPAEGRAQMVVGVTLEDAPDDPFGSILVPVTHSASSQYLVGDDDEDRFPGGLAPYRGRGRFVLLDTGDPYGAILVPVVFVGCDAGPGQNIGPDAPGIIVEDFGADSGVLVDKQRFAERTRLTPYLDQSDVDAWGAMLRFKGAAGCPNLATLDVEELYGPGAVVWRYAGGPRPYISGLPEEEGYDPAKHLYHYDVFGVRCVSCPILFIGFERPVIGCSYRPGELPDPVLSHATGFLQPHDEIVKDWCAVNPGPLDLGRAHCIPPYPPDDPRHVPAAGTACDFDESGNPTEHHCEKCVYERCLGALVNKVLVESDALAKVPMKPSYGWPCPYGCGRFGWELWTQSGSGLRIHGINDPDNGRYGFLPWGDTPWENLLIMETECTDPFNDCRNGNGVYESGGILCGRELIMCGDTEWWTQTHWFQWQKDSPGNKITEARLCFKQWEACDPQFRPCLSNPVQTQGGYHNPSSEIMVWVDCHIEITLVFDHWGPRPQVGCANPEYTPPSDQVIVTVKGEFCGPIPWGNSASGSWWGYDENYWDPYNYPGISGEDIGPASVRGACGGMFVHQGTYDDFLGGEPAYPPYDFFDEVSEPPQRCPSHIAGPSSGARPACSGLGLGAAAGPTLWTLTPTMSPATAPIRFSAAVSAGRRRWSRTAATAVPPEPS